MQKIPAATKHFTFPSLPNSFMYDPISENEVYSSVSQPRIRALK